MSEAEETSLQIKIYNLLEKCIQPKGSHWTQLKKKKTWENENNIWHEVLTTQQNGSSYEKSFENWRPKDTSLMKSASPDSCMALTAPGAHCPLSPSPRQQCTFTIMHCSTVVVPAISPSICRTTERNRTLLRVGHWCKWHKLFSWCYSFPKSMKNPAICIYYRDSILLILCKLQCKVTKFSRFSLL